MKKIVIISILFFIESIAYATVTLTGSTTSYIQSRKTLQAGTTLYVSSGTISDFHSNSIIYKQNTLQSGATFYVSSGTAVNLNTTTLKATNFTISETLTLSSATITNLNTTTAKVATIQSVSGSTAATISSGGEINRPLQPAFLVVMSANATDVTGNGTVYTVPFDSEIYDQSNDFGLVSSTYAFTAPVTGRYILSARIGIYGIDVANMNTIYMMLVTSNRTYEVYKYESVIKLPMTNDVADITVGADMDAGDIAYVKIMVDGGAKTADIRGGASSVRTYFSGYLAN